MMSEKQAGNTTQQAHHERGAARAGRSVTALLVCVRVRRAEQRTAPRRSVPKTGESKTGETVGVTAAIRQQMMSGPAMWCAESEQWSVGGHVKQRTTMHNTLVQQPMRIERDRGEQVRHAMGMTGWRATSETNGRPLERSQRSQLEPKAAATHNVSRERDTKEDRPTDIHTDRQTDRQTDIHTETWRQIPRETD
jgi:hypothetical protein